MTHQITATKGNHQVEQEADTNRLLKLWLRAFRRSGWTVGKVVEVK